MQDSQNWSLKPEQLFKELNTSENGLTNNPMKLELRGWLAHNVKGLGLKEACLFLQNMGYTNLAIIDFHILDLLVKNKLLKEPKTITPKVYLQAEIILKDIAKKANLNLAELDLYLWYVETDKIIK
ncbi:MAG: hypothetical protein COT14_00755 [Candidatus Diapherotrites archaeon CG08_land_8_20_14_0_20_30_16]|nr:MAG: hypothetical protein COT14_00755 [Candidatus Diapherotrites archaeon CG08_land_8_20_14_0_20_30_16]